MGLNISDFILVNLEFWRAGTSPGDPQLAQGYTYKDQKTVGITAFPRIESRSRGNLMNTIVYEDFWVPFPKVMYLHQKASGFPVNLDGIPRHRQS